MIPQESRSENNIDNKYNNEEITLKTVVLNIHHWFYDISKYWKTIILTGIIGALLGFIYAYHSKATYTANSTFVLQEGDGAEGLGQLSGLASVVGLDLTTGGGGIFKGDNIFELYRSRNMIVKTLLTKTKFNSKSQLLINSYIEINKLRNGWKKPELKNLQFDDRYGLSQSRLKDSILGSVVADINKNYLVVTKPDKKLSIIQVTVKSYSEEFSKEFNDKIVQNVNDFYVQTKTKKAFVNLDILQHQTDSVKQVLSGAIFTTAQLNDATPNLNLSRQVLKAPVQRSQINIESSKTLYSELVKNLELAKLSLRKETPLIQLIDEPIYPLAVNKPSILSSSFIGLVLATIIVIICISVKLIYKKIML